MKRTMDGCRSVERDKSIALLVIALKATEHVDTEAVSGYDL